MFPISPRGHELPHLCGRLPNDERVVIFHMKLNQTNEIQPNPSESQQTLGLIDRIVKTMHKYHAGRVFEVSALMSQVFPLDEKEIDLDELQPTLTMSDSSLVLLMLVSRRSSETELLLQQEYNNVGVRGKTLFEGKVVWRETRRERLAYTKREPKLETRTSAKTKQFNRNRIF